MLRRLARHVYKITVDVVRGPDDGLTMTPAMQSNDD